MPNLPPDHVPDYVRERVYRRWGFDAQRFSILDYAGHHALLANPRFDTPYIVIDLDDGATMGLYAEPAEALDRLHELTG